MSEKKVKKSKKAPIIITAAVCVMLILVVVYLLAFADAVNAGRRLSEVRDAAEKAYELTLTDLRYEDSILPTSAEAYLRGDQAHEIASMLIGATESADFDTLKSGKAGFWDVSIRLYGEDEVLYFYLLEDSFYVTRGGVGYVMSPKGESAEAYAALYARVNELIAQSVAQ